MSAPNGPARGEIWRYHPVINRAGRSDLRLVVSTDAVNRNLTIPVVWAVHLVAQPAESLLAVRVGPHGHAAAGTLEQVVRRRLIERLDTASTEVMEHVDIALRALLEL